jgi:glycosyltransferase involved in cell wall biosynthesis
MTPLVTIAIPVYKRLETLAGALRSVAAQDYPQIDLLVSDNGENGDLVPAIIDEHFPRPYRFRQNPQTVPMDVHYNQLIDAALGEYYALLSDDDEISPNFVSELVGLLRDRPQATAALARVETFADDGTVLASTDMAPLPPDVMEGADFIRRWGRYEHKFLSFTTVLSRTADLRKVGGYPDFDRGNGFDNALLLKQCLGREVLFSPRATFRHRVHHTGQGLAASTTSLARASRQFLRFLQHDPYVLEYARTHPEVWHSIRAETTYIIWSTYHSRWANMYRDRLSQTEWVRSAFQLPYIPAYYARVFDTFSKTWPWLAAFKRGILRLRPGRRHSY